MSKPNTVVRFTRAQHKEKAIIKIEFVYDPVLAIRVKALPGAKWSQTMKCLYVPDTKNYRTRFKLEVKKVSGLVLQNLCAENEAAYRLCKGAAIERL